MPAISQCDKKTTWFFPSFNNPIDEILSINFMRQNQRVFNFFRFQRFFCCSIRVWNLNWIRNVLSQWDVYWVRIGVDKSWSASSQWNGWSNLPYFTLLYKTNGDLCLSELNHDKSFMGKMFCLIGHRFEVLTQESRKRTTSIINFRLFCFVLLCLWKASDIALQGTLVRGKSSVKSQQNNRVTLHQRSVVRFLWFRADFELIHFAQLDELMLLPFSN